MSCQGCDGCSWLDPNIPSNMHEIHLTVDRSPPFTMLMWYGFKCTTIDLKNGEQQIMLTKRMSGTEEEVLACATARAKHMQLDGYEVQRIKIETTPTNALVISKQLGYFEAHIKVEGVWDTLWESLKCFANGNFHLSANAVRPETYFLTYRSKANFDHVKYMVQEKVCDLKANCYDVSDVIFEYCWHDTNEGLDSKWISG